MADRDDADVEAPWPVKGRARTSKLAIGMGVVFVLLFAAASWRAGAILAYAGTTPERCQKTLDVLLFELRRLAEGVTEEEVARAKVSILSSLVMQSEATRSRALSIGRDQFLLGQVRSMEEIRAGIEAVTPESIREHLERHPARDFTIVTLGPTELTVSA